MKTSPVHVVYRYKGKPVMTMVHQSTPWIPRINETVMIPGRTGTVRSVIWKFVDDNDFLVTHPTVVVHVS